MKTFTVVNRFVPDMETRRADYRPDHLTWLQAAAESGRVVMAGAVVDPVDHNLLVVRGEGPAEVRAWLLADPYAQAGLIHTVEVREYNLVIGG